MLNQILQQDYFELFSIPKQFEIDLLLLQERLRELQKQFHPDNFVGHDQSLANQAVIASSQINHAYVTLRDPLSRAIYLLAQLGTTVDLVHDTKFEPEFLLEQIELREELAEAEADADFERLEHIEAGIKSNINQLTRQISQHFAGADYPAIVELVKKLAFYSKLEQTVSGIITSYFG